MLRDLAPVEPQRSRDLGRRRSRQRHREQRVIAGVEPRCGRRLVARGDRRERSAPRGRGRRFSRRQSSVAAACTAARGPAPIDGSPIESLTERELQIARLIVDRKTNREIATELFLGQKTIETQIRNVFHKLDVSSRVEVARVVERELRA